MANPHRIFINLPVEDLNRSMDFFRALGFTFNRQFSDEKGATLAIGGGIFVMMLLKPVFKAFITNEVADSKASEVIIALPVDSREAVDALADKALSAGGAPSNEPRSLSFYYNRSFLDPDGHHWEIYFMEPGFIQAD